MTLLVWSLISFLVGILTFNILDTETNGHVSNVAFGVIAVAGVVLILIFLVIWSLSERSASEDHIPFRKLVSDMLCRSWKRICGLLRRE